VPYTTPIVLAHNLNTPYDIIADESNVYWSDPGDSSIWQVGINGGSPTPIATGQAGPSYIDLGGDYVYWLAPSAINRVHKGGGPVQSVVTVAGQGISVAGDSVTYVANGTFYSVAGAGGTPTPLGTPMTTSPPTIGINGSSGRLAGTLFWDGYKLWTPTGAIAVGGGVAALGRGGEYLRLGGTFIGPSTPIPSIPGSIDISGSYYFSSKGIAWYAGLGAQRLLVATSQPRHLYATGGAVYWTDGRSVLKALTCSQ
jgi:hypothetical protein